MTKTIMTHLHHHIEDFHLHRPQFEQKQCLSIVKMQERLRESKSLRYGSGKPTVGIAFSELHRKKIMTQMHYQKWEFLIFRGSANVLDM